MSLTPDFLDRLRQTRAAAKALFEANTRAVARVRAAWKAAQQYHQTVQALYRGQPPASVAARGLPRPGTADTRPPAVHGPFLRTPLLTALYLAFHHACPSVFAPDGSLGVDGAQAFVQWLYAEGHLTATDHDTLQQQLRGWPPGLRWRGEPGTQN
jgi:hypothetical protein